MFFRRGRCSSCRDRIDRSSYWIGSHGAVGNIWPTASDSGVLGLVDSIGLGEIPSLRAGVG